MNLFEINAQIMNCVDTETGEIVDIDKLMQLTLEKNDKVDNVACYIKNLEADAKAYEEQEKSFAERKTAAKKKIEGLKRYLSEALDGKSFKSDRCEVKFRKSTAVNVLDESVVPVEYMVDCLRGIARSMQSLSCKGSRSLLLRHSGTVRRAS